MPVESIPPDTIVDGAIIDAVAVADAIRRIFDTKRFKAKDVVASLSGNAVIVKKIALPVMTDAELAESIHWEAEQYIPFDIQDVHLDYQVLDRGTGEAGKQTMDVLLVAAKQDKIADYTGVISQAGRNAVIVDVDAFAVQNCYEANYGVSPGVTVLLNAGASAINVNIVARRPVALHPRHLDRRQRLHRSGAEGVQPRVRRRRAGQAGHRARRRDVRRGAAVLRTVSDTVLLEIQKTFDFFKATTSDEHDRPHRRLRRRVRASTDSPTCSRSASAPRSSASIRSRP